ncbi:MAG: hypothetical protein ACI90V_013853, partial [Bacillariaceae sp.]
QQIKNNCQNMCSSLPKTKTVSTCVNAWGWMGIIKPHSIVCT